MYNKNMKVLVTGGAGYIGSHIVELLIKTKSNIIIIDNLVTGHKKLLNKKVYIRSDELNEVDETRFLGHKLLGYTVIDQQIGILGPLVQVLEQKGNPLFVIEKGGNEILIPLFEGLLLAIDEKKKEMLINAPEGLIDLYLQ